MKPSNLVSGKIVILLLLIVAMLLSTNPRAVSASASYGVTANVYTVDDLLEVATPALDAWGRLLIKQRGYRYRPPTLVVFNRYLPGPAASPCGQIDVGGAAYCSANETVYVDFKFLSRALSSIGDHAPATVLAHEWSHHLQAIGRWGLWGLDPARSELGRELQRMATELQADCMTGLFSRYAANQNLLSPGDVDEADRILRRDDPFAPPYLRAQHFWKGFHSGDMASCSIN